MIYRITPEELKRKDIGEDDIFVFGSNEKGIHGAGAALFAFQELGFPKGLGFGMRDNDSAFALPTKDWEIKTLPLESINFYISRFIEYAKLCWGLKFYVTQIGCGLAGYKPYQIAPMFRNAINLENVYLPLCFWEVLDYQENKFEIDSQVRELKENVD